MATKHTDDPQLAAEDGPTTRATRATLVERGADPATNAVAALALHLAGVLDRGEARSQVSNVARELRACLLEVRRTHTPASDLDDVDRFLLGTWGTTTS